MKMELDKNHKKYHVFIGRWSPLHFGHEFIIHQKMKEMKDPILVLVRDTPVNENNPFTTDQVVNMLRKRYKHENVRVEPFPDILSVNWGRGVGYETNEHEVPDGVAKISATEIRNKINNGDESWRECVNPLIQEDIVNYLKENESQ